MIQKGETPVHCAAFSGKTKILEFLYASGRKLCDVNTRNKVSAAGEDNIHQLDRGHPEGDGDGDGGGRWPILKQRVLRSEWRHSLYHCCNLEPTRGFELSHREGQC